MSELPKGWINVSLGDIAGFEMGQAPPGDQCNKDGNGTVFVKAGEFGVDYPLVREWTTRPLKFAYRGDVLICVVGATSGKLNLGIDCAIGRSVAAIRPNASVSQKIIYRQLQLQVEQLRADSTGTAQGVISKQMLADIRLVLPPAAEQTRIANQLDTLLTRIQSCNDRFDAIPALLKRFRQAICAAATIGPWEPSTIGAISVDLRYGTSKKCDYIPTGTGVLRIPNIADQGRIDVTDLKRAEFDANELQKLALMEGDLLVIRSNGSVELVGKTGLVTEKESGLLFAGYLMRLRVDRTMAVPAFIQLCLSAPLQREYIERTAKSTSGVNNLNAEELRSLPLLLPPLSEQTEIVRRAKTLLALADRIEARANAARTQAQRLSPLVLAKAFRGELVQQDPQDEPASVLLERIASQRIGPAAKKQSKPPRQVRASRAPKEAAAVTKSRQDEDVKGKPYLAEHLRRLGSPTTAEVLFRASELPIADFYKQLAWEVAQGHIADGGTTLEVRHAAG